MLPTFTNPDFDHQVRELFDVNEYPELATAMAEAAEPLNVLGELRELIKAKVLMQDRIDESEHQAELDRLKARYRDRLTAILANVEVIEELIGEEDVR